MPLSVLVLVVALGLVMVIGAARFFGTANSPFLLNDETAREIFSTEYPENKIVDVVVSDDATAALIFIERHLAIGLVKAMGHKCVTRFIDLQGLSEFEENSHGIRLNLKDAGLPNSYLALRQHADRAKIVRWLKAMEK